MQHSSDHKAPFKKDQPKDGEVVLLCPHTGQGRRFHWFRTPNGPSEFTRPDGSKGMAQWLAVCEECFAKYEHPIEAITQDYEFDGDHPVIREGKQ